MTGVDGEQYFIDSHENYLNIYGVEFGNLYWIRSVPVLACIETTHSGAEQFIADHTGRLLDPKVVAIELGKPIPADQAAQFPF